MRGIVETCVMAFLMVLVTPVSAADLVLKPLNVAPDVYAVIGDLGGQTYENDGQNSNLGFVVTKDGVVVINSGSSARVAKALHIAIQKITNQSIKYVINVNSQAHYWLGNSYFASLGVPILAHKEADRLMREMGSMQLNGAREALKDRADGTELSYPTELVSESKEMTVGGTELHVLYYGSAHTAGDIAVWLPGQKVLFSGDLVFTERLMAVLPIGSSGGWVTAFDRAMALKPARIVPGHGKPTDIKRATEDTRDYLVQMREAAKKIQEEGGSILDAVQNIDQSRFKGLSNFDTLARRNVNQIFTEIEQESF